MRPIQQLLKEYAESHTHATNKAIHFICVPVIYFSILALLSEVVLCDGIWLSWLVAVPVLIFYFRLSARLGAVMLLVMLLCFALFWAGKMMLGTYTLYLWIALFVAAWIGQFYGHKVEGKKPSFFQDLQFLLIGPAWVMQHLLEKISA